MDLSLLVAFDYELFLGRNFVGPEEVLFAPTQRLLERCAALDLKVTFFADICSVWAHREHGQHAYADAFEAQLKEAVAQGHDVQLHVHPHWLFARPVDGQWVPDASKLYLAECGFGPGPNEVPAVLKRGVQYLEALLQPVRSDYRCVAFRGPGLVLQPDDGKLVAALLEAGIRVDSSVTKGVVIDTPSLKLDYRDTPAAPNWFMAPETGVTRSAPRGLYEVPIATFQPGRRRRVEFLARRVRAVGQLRGTAISRGAPTSRLVGLAGMVRNNARYLLDGAWFNLTTDTKGYTLGLLEDGIAQYLERHAGASQVAISTVNHPKLTFAPQLELLEQLVTSLRRRHGSALRLPTFQALDVPAA